MSTSFVSPCWCPSGCQENYSDYYKGSFCWDENDSCHHYPCFSGWLAETWESERKECVDGDLSKCCCDGLTLRICRPVISTLDIAVGIVALPIFCLGGSGLSCGIGCVGLCCCGVAKASSCCLEDDSQWKKKVEHEGKDNLLGSADLCINIGKFSLAFLGGTLNGLLRLPVNILCPELSEVAWQEESNLFINRHTRWKVYCEETPEANGEATPQSQASSATPVAPHPTPTDPATTDNQTPQ